MTVRVYKSTDDSAPVFTGMEGSFISLIDAVLVNGYGTTLSAGWTKPFSGTNLAVYRNSPTGGTGMYFRFNDTSTTTSFPNVTYRGYETMTGISTGTGAFPIDFELNIGRAKNRNTTAMEWVIIADQYSCHILIKYATTDYYQHNYFGDFFSYKSGDAFRSLSCATRVFESYSPFLTRNINVFSPRSHTGTGTVVSMGKAANRIGVSYDEYNWQYITSGTRGSPYPHPMDGKLHLSKCYIGENNVLRGYIRGLRYPLHIRPLNDLDVFYGTGSIAGKTFQCFKIYGATDYQVSDYGILCIEISDTWETSV